MNKIKAVTVIMHPQPKIYTVGEKHNGMLIGSIEDFSQEFPDGWNNLIIGFTKDRDAVFELVNAPYLLEYEEDFC